MKPPLTILLTASRANRLTTDPLTGQPVCPCRGRVAECPARGLGCTCVSAEFLRTASSGPSWLSVLSHAGRAASAFVLV
jgi:hypothetical protein